MKILLTGANGFVGMNLSYALSQAGAYELVLPVRSPPNNSSLTYSHIENIDANTYWSAHLNEVDVVIHLAGIAQVMHSSSAKDETKVLSQYHSVNVEGTLNLAKQAIEAGVKRFIFLSSIKVNGEQTSPNTPFTENDTPAPQDPYAQSKWQAEQVLQALAHDSKLEVVIIRPPLIYGPGVKGNFAKLFSLIQSGVPLPFASLYNQRSMVSTDNLSDFIKVCLTHPAAAHQVFLISDGDDMSTSTLLHKMATAMNKPSRLFRVPMRIFNICAQLIKKEAVFYRLFGSLQVDLAKAQSRLGWKPPFSVEASLKKCCQSAHKEGPF